MTEHEKELEDLKEIQNLLQKIIEQDETKEQFKYDVFRELITIKNMLRGLKDSLLQKNPTEDVSEDK